MTDAKENLIKCLNNSLSEIGYKDCEYEIRPISSGASNFTTILFEVTVSHPGKDALHLFAKTATIGEKFREQMNADVIYDNEYRFYKKLVQVYNQLYDNNKVPKEDRIVFSKFYGGTLESGAEVLVLEDLSKTKFTLFDRMKPLDWEHAAVSIKDLAKFHALGFALKKEHPDIYEEFDNNKHYQETFAKIQPQFVKMITESLELIDPEYRSRIGALLSNEELMMQFMTNSVGSGHHTLIHGDFRTSNMMFKRQGGKLVCVLVDFQTMRSGNIFQDIMYLITVNTDVKFRKYHWDQIMSYYYTELTKSLRQLGLDETEVYPKEAFDQDLKLSLPMGVIIGVMTTPIVLVDTEVAPDMSGDDVGIENFKVPASETCRIRMNDLVRDFARMGAI